MQRIRPVNKRPKVLTMKSKLSIHGYDVPFTAGRKPLVIKPGPKVAVLLAGTLSVIPVSSQGDSSPITWRERIEVAHGKTVRGP